MSALSLYITVCRQLFDSCSSADQNKDEVWEETARKLKRLRHALQCRSCKRISRDLYGSTGCLHLTCGSCKERKRGKFTACRFCKNCEELELNKQHNCVLKCYAKICELLRSYLLHGSDCERNGRIEQLLELIYEGSTLFDTTHEGASNQGSLGHPSSSADTGQIRMIDVGHVTCENKVSQDGGGLRKDGGFFKQTYSAKEDRIFHQDQLAEKVTVSSENRNGKNEVDSATVTELESPLAIKDAKNTQAETKTKKMSVTENENATSIMPKFPTNDHETPINGESNLESKKNGYLDQQLLQEMEMNSNFQSIPRKRRSIQADTHESLAPRNELKNLAKKGRLYQNDNAKQGHFSENTGNQSPCDDEEVLFDERLPRVDEAKRQNLHGNRKSSVRSVKKQLVTEGRDTLIEKDRADNGNRHSLMRKNKYKCSCGTSNNRYFSDICNHSRCVCYAAGVPCVACKCKYCSNPHQSHYNVKWSALGFESDKQSVKIETSVGNS
ncbi:E3 ubiquitin-protein ligase msl-2-like [Rhopilema esculentum]|uniref:E3 ubiquitin-protein ligase msl-2-like n=1 Tax=Rhopilema esculentum TaxID=499914 RepID=UPI0031D43F82|eukprot:gene16735-8192_t